MTRTQKIIVSGCAGFFAIPVCACLLIVVTSAIEASRQSGSGATVNKSSAFDCIQEWARVSRLPESAQDIRIVSEGEMFTRSFRMTARLSENQLQDWIKSSPGLQDAKKEERSSGVWFYFIRAGGGAVHAEAQIDFKTGIVEVYTFWS